MDVKRLGQLLIAIGLIGLVVSVLWWGVFYSQVIRNLGGTLGDASRCLYSNGGPCGLVSAGAEMMGKTSYSPAAFWLAIGATVVGFLLNATSQASGMAQPDSAVPSRRCPHCGHSNDVEALSCHHCTKPMPAIGGQAVVTSSPGPSASAQAQSRFCTECGKSMAIGSRFCSSCGTAVVAS